MLPEWTPGPGTYVLPTDFVKKFEERNIPAEMEGQEPLVEVHPRWDQKGFG